MYAENVYVELAEIYCKDAKWDTDSFKTETLKKITKMFGSFRKFL